MKFTRRVIFKIAAARAEYRGTRFLSFKIL